MRAALVPRSRFLSRVLRHAPEAIGLELDGAGRADVAQLLDRARAHGVALDRPALDEIVATNDKLRFAFDADRRRIRAQQGHSIDVELGLAPLEPPARPYHGTATRHLRAILRDGLHRGRRRHVHLSADPVVARQVGTRHGLPAVLGVRAQAMHAQGHAFFLTANGVWLVERVPRAFLEYPLDPTGDAGPPPRGDASACASD